MRRETHDNRIIVVVQFILTRSDIDREESSVILRAKGWPDMTFECFGSKAGYLFR